MCSVAHIPISAVANQSTAEKAWLRSWACQQTKLEAVVFKKPQSTPLAGGRIRPVGRVALGPRWPQRHSRCGAGANAPNFIKGVANLRGVIATIVDLRLKFGLADTALDGRTVTTVLNVAQRVVADSVSDCYNSTPSSLGLRPNSTASSPTTTSLALTP